MRFSEFHAGQVIEAGPYAVTEAEVLRFARAYDPQLFNNQGREVLDLQATSLFDLSGT